MSGKHLTWARTQMPRNAKGNPDPEAKLVLLVLIDHADDNGYCFPGQPLISAESGLGVTTVANRLNALEAASPPYFARAWRRHDTGPRMGQRTSDEYTLNFARPADPLERDCPQPAGLRRGRGKVVRERGPAGMDAPDDDDGLVADVLSPTDVADRETWRSKKAAEWEAKAPREEADQAWQRQPRDRGDHGDLGTRR